MEKIEIILPNGLNKKDVLEYIADANDYQPFKIIKERREVKTLEEVKELEYDIIQKYMDKDDTITKYLIEVITKIPRPTKEEYGKILIGKSIIRLFEDAKNKEYLQKIEELKQNIKSNATYDVDYSTGKVI